MSHQVDQGAAAAPCADSLAAPATKRPLEDPTTSSPKRRSIPIPGDATAMSGVERSDKGPTQEQSEEAALRPLTFTAINQSQVPVAK